MTMEKHGPSKPDFFFKPTSFKVGKSFQEVLNLMQTKQKIWLDRCLEIFDLGFCTSCFAVLELLFSHFSELGHLLNAHLKSSRKMFPSHLSVCSHLT